MDEDVMSLIIPENLLECKICFRVYEFHIIFILRVRGNDSKKRHERLLFTHERREKALNYFWLFSFIHRAKFMHRSFFAYPVDTGSSDSARFARVFAPS